jgi:hypothetical protein
MKSVFFAFFLLFTAHFLLSIEAIEEHRETCEFCKGGNCAKKAIYEGICNSTEEVGCFTGFRKSGNEVIGKVGFLWV